MEHTKGKLKREINQIVPVAVMGDGKTAIVILGDTTTEKAEANAKELVRRWNAFEKDGLVTDLLTACEVGFSYIQAIAHRIPRPLGDLSDDRELVKVAITKATKK